MNDFKLKIVLSVLGGIIFSFVFILLALALPVDKKNTFNSKPKNLLEQVSDSIR